MADTFAPKLIIFDLGKTLLKDNPWLKLNLAMGVTQEEDDLLGKWGSNGVINDQQGQDILCALYKERNNPTRERISSVLSGYGYFAGAKEAVKALQDKGFELAILTGSMDVIAERVAGDLGIKRWACNNLFHFGEDGSLERIETVMNEAEFKAVQLAKWCNELGIRSSDVALVADGSNDLWVASLAGYVVVVGTGSVLDDKADVAIGEAEYDKLPGCFTK